MLNITSLSYDVLLMIFENLLKEHHVWIARTCTLFYNIIRQLYKIDERIYTGPKSYLNSISQFEFVICEKKLSSSILRKAIKYSTLDVYLHINDHFRKDNGKISILMYAIYHNCNFNYRNVMRAAKRHPNNDIYLWLKKNICYINSHI